MRTAWFPLKGDERLGRCATQGCGGQPIWRFEGGGIGSNYCSGCYAKIGYLHPTCIDPGAHEQTGDRKP